jgi:hypothetical protein
MDRAARQREMVGPSSVLTCRTNDDAVVATALGATPQVFVVLDSVVARQPARLKVDVTQSANPGVMVRLVSSTNPDAATRCADDREVWLAGPASLLRDAVLQIQIPVLVTVRVVQPGDEPVLEPVTLAHGVSHTLTWGAPR